jgi:hypothetical protein
MKVAKFAQRMMTNNITAFPVCARVVAKTAQRGQSVATDNMTIS